MLFILGMGKDIIHPSFELYKMPESHECGRVEECVVAMFLGLSMQICKHGVIVHCQIGLWESSDWMHNSICEHKTNFLHMMLEVHQGSQMGSHVSTPFG